MELIGFPEQTVVIANNQPQYRPLPAHRFDGDRKGRIAFCWALSWRERITLLIRGRIWHEVLTFNHPLQPQLLSIDKPDMAGPQAVKRMTIRINGRTLPAWCFTVDQRQGTVTFTRRGRAVVWVLQLLRGSTYTEVRYPYDDARAR